MQPVSNYKRTYDQISAEGDNYVKYQKTTTSWINRVISWVSSHGVAKKEELTLTSFMKYGSVVTKLAKFLSVRDLLNLECVAKSFRRDTIVVWKELRKEDCLRFDWAACEGEFEEKLNYLLSTALTDYVQLRALNPSPMFRLERSQQLYKRFESLMRRFPSFALYVQRDLFKLASSSCPIASNLEQQRPHILEAALQGWEGELLLWALLEIQEYENENTKITSEEHANLITDYIIKAINKGNTCVSHLIIGFLESRLRAPDCDRIQALIALKAAEQNDFRALEDLIEGEMKLQVEGETELPQAIKNLIQQGYRFPPIVSRLAIHEKDALQAEKLFDEALEGYDRALKCCRYSQIPLDVLAHAVVTKKKAGKWEEADKLCSKAIVAYKKEIKREHPNYLPGEIVIPMAEVKLRFQKWKEADWLYKDIVSTYENKEEGTPYWLYQNTAAIKVSLEKWEQAKIFCDAAIEACGNEPIPERLLKIDSRIKKELQAKNN